MQARANILVVDDERQIRRVVRVALEEQGYAVSEARSGEEAVEALARQPVDLVLLDMLMPVTGGMSACRAIRALSDVAIVVLSVRSSEKDKVEALDAGADDYVTKPFGEPELMARIRAALRRAPLPADTPRQLITLGDLQINLAARTVTGPGGSVRLTPKEFDLLEYLVENPNVTLLHSRLLQAVWGPDYGGEVEYLRVFVNRLRKKIEPDPANPRYLLTEPWTGYRFDPTGGSA
ncbi:MAG: response regulator transcription factor [Bryobacterales bacterium]|nr:response regulator transcription factor [Bryobacterales bacterium]